MSLKAYDGMMSRKGIKYIQDEILIRLDKFREASENKLAEKFADIFIDYFDRNNNIIKDFYYDTHGDSATEEKLNDIKINDDTTILSYIFQVSKVLSQASAINDFMCHLNISIQAINNRKILVYPNIIVQEHKQILLEFLEDWYCQNQSDADESVSRRQWKQREKDWYSFDTAQGFNIKIQLFDPAHYWHSINKNLRGDKLVCKILEHIPSDETRIKDIAKRHLIAEIDKNSKKKGEKISYYDIIERLSNVDNTEIEDYIKTHNIQIIKIDEDVIENSRLNYNPEKEIRKDKLNKINAI